MFREAIRKEMHRRGWSSYRLGKESGVAIRTVQKYTSGAGDLLGAKIEKLLRALDLKIVGAGKNGKRRKAKV